MAPSCRRVHCTYCALRVRCVCAACVRCVCAARVRCVCAAYVRRACALQAALAHCREFSRTGQEAVLQHAWESFYAVLKHLARELHDSKTLQLSSVSPQLLQVARGEDFGLVKVSGWARGGW